jgi:hypothetical protein
MVIEFDIFVKGICEGVRDREAYIRNVDIKSPGQNPVRPVRLWRR